MAPPRTRKQVPARPPAPDVGADLAALVNYLHASAHSDLFNAIAAEELTFNQLHLLDRLRGDWKPTVQAASRYLRVDKSSASRLVDQLARRGLVMREPADNDQRVKRIAITDRGREVIARLHACRVDRVQAFAAGLSDDERRAFDRALSKLAKRDEIAAYRPIAA